MRVIAGKYKGYPLAAPAYRFIRPTTDRVKTAIFNILPHDIWESAVVLDLYAGTGNLGIEALSRGAKKVVFIDKSPLAVKIIKKNLSKIGVKANVWKRDILKGLSFLNDKFSIIFMDPPYEKGYVEKTLLIIEKRKKEILEKEGLIVIEHSPKEKFALLGFKLITCKHYGQTQVSILLGEE
ncbi:MAG TPA: 16S rRNA (guanine(966)-N(2))-methyltransferase RsmD [Candidatus Desulfofervidus auxilii]|uniref:16S rRNA (Guanine(966)-N(2))-methyltransferase RsmD n=1 Tax=Desulfofervidus auxilii TaxID=1621989 RepID=A0A7V0NE30_DESA2|nr:16S rRNA (guanine(966)-N(2))-methyltransferase RsmD [Candidatus Desulfofervidus auxilii]